MLPIKTFDNVEVLLWAGVITGKVILGVIGVYVN